MINAILQDTFTTTLTPKNGLEEYNRKFEEKRKMIQIEKFYKRLEKTRKIKKEKGY